MEINKNEILSEAMKEFRGTIFEYSSSDSDEEEENKKNQNFDLFLSKKPKSAINLSELNGKIHKQIKILYIYQDMFVCFYFFFFLFLV